MARYMLDASFLIDHLRGLPEATKRFIAMNEAGDALIISDVAAAEVWSGRPTEEPAFADLVRYLEFAQPGPDTSRLAGRWRAEARGRGASLELTDALIAASAHHLDAAVLTRNVRDFALTPVRVETY
jgi:predicted nucleic acid-binding protein